MPANHLIPAYGSLAPLELLGPAQELVAWDSGFSLVRRGGTPVLALCADDRGSEETLAADWGPNWGHESGVVT
jgi:hypothetical protein